jgi:hypothetical protein
MADKILHFHGFTAHSSCRCFQRKRIGVNIEMFISVYLPTSSNVVIIAGQPRLAVKRSQRLLNQATGHIVSCFNLNMHSPTRNVLFEGKALFLYVYSKDSSGLNHHWADPLVAILTIMYTSSTAQGGGGSFRIGNL